MRCTSEFVSASLCALSALPLPGIKALIGSCELSCEESWVCICIEYG